VQCGRGGFAHDSQRAAQTGQESPVPVPETVALPGIIVMPPRFPPKLPATDQTPFSNQEPNEVRVSAERSRRGNLVGLNAGGAVMRPASMDFSAVPLRV
jgi:hypothetical protein